MKVIDIFNKGKLITPWQIFDADKHIAQYLRSCPNIKSAMKGIVEQIPEYPDLKTLVGIEIECEKVDARMWNLPTWQIKPDGSLRNQGIEFISPAFFPNQVRENLALVLAWMEVHSPHADFSWRTSIHVHLDCLALDINEFKVLLLLYLLFEDALFQYANPGRRETNIFCTPLTRTNFYALNGFINAEHPDVMRGTFESLCAAFKKYSALNLNHMYDFGTIEFRHLRGTGDPKKLGLWIALLLQLYDACGKITATELTNDIASLNTTSAYSAFARKIFGGDLAAVISSPFNQRFLSKGVSLAKEVVYGHTLFKTLTYSPTGGLAKFVTLKESQRKRDTLGLKSKRLRAMIG